MLDPCFHTVCRSLARRFGELPLQTAAPAIRRSCAALSIALLVAVAPAVALAQAAVSSIQPRSCRPGETTRLVVAGQGFAEGLRAAATQAGATVAIQSIQPDRVTLDVTLPADIPLGPLGLWLASASGPTEPLAVIVDDLPTVAEAADNHLPATAQPLETLTAVDGVSKGANSSFYQIQVTAGQRVAVEVLAQPLESAMDPVVRLLDSAGQTLLVVDDDATSPDCRFAHTFTEAGKYLIEVRDNRYTAGGLYRLRVGDFPILAHAFPLAVTAGQAVTVRFSGPDGERCESRDLELADAQVGSITTVATRLLGGRSSSWVPLAVTAAAQHVEAASADATAGSPLRGPAMISGRLSEPNQRDRYAIQGVTGQTVRVRALTRSLGCPTLLRMRLLAPADAAGAEPQVAETPVNNADEWSFDYAFADDRVYTLEVTDLLGRGGEGFGYAVEVTPAGRFAMQLKPDAAVRQHFALEAGPGAAAIDVQLQRFGYDGAIDLALSEPQPGLRILNPRIAAGATEAKVLLAADASWQPQSLAAVKLIGRATAAPETVATLSSTAWQRVKKPHVPFPIHWNSGVVLLGGVAPAAAYFAVEPTAPPKLARPLASHNLTLQLKRIDEAFKGGVTLLPDALPAGWQAEIKPENDTFAVSLSRPADAPAAPETLRLLAVAEHGARCRAETLELTPQWYDPLTISVAPLASASAAANEAALLVAGQKSTWVARVQRDGGDPQPVTLTFVTADAAPIRLPESVTLPADQDAVEFEVEVLPSESLGDGQRQLVVDFKATSSHQGQAFNLTGQCATVDVIAAPASIDVYPPQIKLSGSKDRQQVVVTGYSKLKTPRDWTTRATLTSLDPAIAEVRGTAIFAKGNGQTQIIVEAAGQRQELPVQVTGTDVPWRTGFESEVLVALSKQGCNSGACHGSPSGKGMFRLSLRAFDAKLDELTLIREDYGRRLNLMQPEESLLLLKPLMKVGHGGGKQLQVEDEAYAILRDWIAAGAQVDPADTPRCVRLEVYPNTKRVLRLEAGSQQIAAIAHFSDGFSRDVTHLVAYESSDTSVAEVSEAGLVTPHQRGEAVILVRFLEHIESVPLMFIQQVADFAWQAPPPANYIDELVNAKLRQLQYVPAPTCTDAEFLRRVHLDIVGSLPTVEEARAFLADESPDKRAQLIDRLLHRDEFAKFWALKWGDLLKMTSKLIGDAGIHKYHRWVEEAFRTNMPYNEFARQLLTGSGSTLSDPPANFYRTATDMNECVENVSQVFLGARLQCAKCHNHPFERWTQDNYYGLGAFFNRVQRRTTERPGEMFVWTSTSGDVTQPRTGEKMKPWLPSHGSIDVADDVDRRHEFAQWLTQPDNPYFAKMEVNRIWAQLFARGIVDPIDDFRDSNPPSNESLLDALAEDFAASGFDRRHIIRVILNSRTYQASYQTTPLNHDDSLYFSHQQPRLLGAEQLLDAINHAVGLKQTFGSLPPGTLATHLPAPDLVKVDFLKVFGQPERTTVCACERVDDSNLGMAIELFNGPTIHEKLRSPEARFRVSLAAGKPLAEVIQEMYLAAFCRLPSDQELAAATEHCSKQEDVAAALEDVCWALLNTDEFLFQH